MAPPWLITDRVLITASIMVTGLTDITDIGLTDISVGAVVIIGVAEAMAGEDMVGGEMKICTKMTFLIRPKWMDNNPVKVNISSL
jgi:formylmethanofuran dehydrogenase subunit C